MKTDQLDLTASEHIVHVGVGAGYYTAILAEIVGAKGEVTAVELDPALAERSRANLALSWPQANVIAADGFAFRPGRSAVIINAGLALGAGGAIARLGADPGPHKFRGVERPLPRPGPFIR